jgi:hypothetical protein
MQVNKQKQIKQLQGQVEHGMALVVRHQQAIDQLEHAMCNLRGYIHLLQYAEPDDAQIQERINRELLVIRDGYWMQR